MTTPSSSPYQSPGVPSVTVPTYAYAHWFQRVGAYLVDSLIGLATLIPATVGVILAIAGMDITTYHDANGDTVIKSWSMTGVAWAGIAIAALGFVAAMAFGIWNIVFRQGTTGATIGKSALGLTLVKEATGKPIGPGMSFVRQVLHILDGAVCNLGYLWPLWDSKRQTLADKCVDTVVIRRR